MSEDLQHIYEMEEGSSIVFYQKYKTVHLSIHSWKHSSKTKRYTWTRLQRACTHILTNTTKEEIHKANIEQHARVSVFSECHKKDKLIFLEIRKK